MTASFDYAIRKLGIDPRKERVPGDEDFPRHMPASVHTVFYTVRTGTDNESDDCSYVAVWADGSWFACGSLPAEWRGLQSATGMVSALSRAVNGRAA